MLLPMQRMGTMAPPLIMLAGAALLLLLPRHTSASSAGLPSCATSCGGVGVPYPFGIGAGCYHSAGFNLTCDGSHDPPRLLLGEDGGFQVVDISLANATVRAARAGGINITVDQSGDDGRGAWRGLGDGGGPYALADDGNELVIVRGCDVLALLTAGGSGNSSNVTISGCASFCPGTDAGRTTLSVSDGRCTGVGCCQMPIGIGRASYDLRFRRLNPGQLPAPAGTGDRPLVLIAEQGWLRQAAASTRGAPLPVNLDETPVPVLLGWAIGSAPLQQGDDQAPSGSTCPVDAAARGACISNHSSCRDVATAVRRGYVCDCQEGYHGNPYLAGGCQDVNECERAEDFGCFGECTNLPGTFECRCPPRTHGNYTQRHGCVPSSSSSLGLSIGIGLGSGACLVIVAIIATVVARRHKRRREMKQRRRFFQQNRGQLLQQLVAHRAGIAERMIMSLDELEKETNNFDRARELGGGGHGTVYKGILSDLHVVAIKKSKVAVQREIDEFINEVAILSQTNHRNVVKLLGCCLEAEVPLLVYEFVPSGTLHEHLHGMGPRSPLPWGDRLRIAAETSKALAYLHSAVSIPIIHRDIKSANILLDGTLTSKVADFGASRHVPVDRTQVTTKVQGTIGYMDPMYYYTGRLTEKSDVYSFGVLLVELLTRKKPSSYLSPEDEGLVAHFAKLVSEDGLEDMLDPQVREETAGGGEDVQQVAALAAACVKLRAEDRPTMRQVEMSLESIRAPPEGHARSGAAREKLEEEKDVGRRPPLAQDSGNTHEVTRRYSFEEEFLMSTRFPR